MGVEAVTPTAGGLVVRTSAGPIVAGRVVVATGGKSVPKMGASGIGYRIAEQTGHRIVPTRPGLPRISTRSPRTAPAASRESIPARSWHM